MNQEEQIESLRNALKHSPDNIPLLKMFGQLCLDNWSLVEARQTFERVLELDPVDLDVHLGIAKVLYQKGNISESMVRMEALLKKNQDFVKGWLFLSRLCISDGQLDQAREYYEKAKALDDQICDGAIEKELNIATSRAESSLSAEESKLLNTEQGWMAEVDDRDEADAYFSEESFSLEDMEKPRVSFHDVGGMENIKDEIRMKIIHPMNNPELFRAYGKKMGGGVLLYGPPGCGKTLVSRATAGEIQASFISIGLHQILDMYIGNSEKNLHDLFELARANRPSVLFIDEIDALAANRTDLRQSAARTLINQFLAEMDGNIDSNEGVLVLGATNAPWHIDPAFRRPGRFDRIIFIPTPDESGRLAILKILAKDKPTENLDFVTLAKKTDGFSGADLKALFDRAFEMVLEKAIKQNRVIPLTTQDLLKTMKLIQPSSRAWFENAKNYALYANQSGLYDSVLEFLNIKKP